jgi:hypothetical protein
MVCTSSFMAEPQRRRQAQVPPKAKNAYFFRALRWTSRPVILTFVGLLVETGERAFAEFSSAAFSSSAAMLTLGTCPEHELGRHGGVAHRRSRN